MTSTELVVRGGRIIDATGERTADIRIRDGVIAEVGTGLDAATVLDAQGCVVGPGLVDLHTHLREPGNEEAETIASGTRAAALGGFTAVVAMPNTQPAADDVTVIEAVRNAAAADGSCDVFPAGCITKGRAGKELAPIGELYAAGVRVFTDDGNCVDDPMMMRRALEYSLAFPGAVLAQHAEDARLAAGGSMHLGEWSSRLGIPGRAAEAETVIIARDVVLAAATGAPVHFLHVSTAAAVELVRDAKRCGLPVTAEAAPHHFTLTDACCASYDPVFKVHPPLRSQADVDAIKAGLADGTIDAIATDHAPHAPETKERPFEDAPPGMLGLETVLALAHTELVETGVVSMAAMWATLSANPARIARCSDHGHTIAPGVPANLCVFDPTTTWEVDPMRQASKSRNTPYAGRKLTGRVRHTIWRGVPTVIDEGLTR
ncbi:MAG: dihydroorotase [Acidimicrobiia bacterium]